MTHYLMSLMRDLETQRIEHSVFVLNFIDGTNSALLTCVKIQNTLFNRSFRSALVAN